MSERFQVKVTGAMIEKARTQGLGLKQWVTLASIIEKETGNKEEMPLVSAVFHNRLRIKMPLQSDPTVIYGIENFDGNLTRKAPGAPKSLQHLPQPGAAAGPHLQPRHGCAAGGPEPRPGDIPLLRFPQ